MRWKDIREEPKHDAAVKEEDMREHDQTFQDGTRDDGTAPSPGGLRGRSSSDWPERDHGHVGETDEKEGEEMGEVEVAEEE